jgi:hypothetical protein
VSSIKHHGFTELNRTFHQLSEHVGESDDIDLSQVFRVKSDLTWADLLKNRRTVILILRKSRHGVRCMSTWSMTAV